MDVDGQAWTASEFHDKPGDVRRPPSIVAPDQPRVDFQLWFFTLGRDGGYHPYFNTLVRRLCARSPAVEPLFTRETRPPAPPLAIRLAYHRYRMTDLATLDRDGVYWRRELLEYHPLAYFCDASEAPRF